MSGFTGFDIIALLFVGAGAVGGFMRGFVQEILSLCAWILAVFAIYTLHTFVTAWLFQFIGTPSGAAVLAFALLLLIPYAGMKLIASWAGSNSRKSVLGPVDRVLGFGFGALKGIIIVVMAFSILVLGYDTVWGVAGRPTWITTARSYGFVNMASEQMVQMIKERHEKINEGDDQVAGS